MALLRADSSYAKVLWWQGRGHHEQFFGGAWHWRPNAYDCSTYPGPSMLEALPFSGTNAGSSFCSGHSQLADGRLMLAGGTQPGTEFGIRQSVMFDASADTGSAWQPRDSMEIHRWYPSLTTLADGRTLTLSGSHHQHLQFWGGLKDSALTPIDSAVFRYGIGGGGRTDSPVRTFISPFWPSPRQEHTGVYNAALGNYTAVFGGKLANGDYTDELWELRRYTNPFGSDYTYGWGQAVTSPAPPPRWRHTAVSLADTNASLVIFGGVGKVFGADECKNDIWRYWFETTPGEGYGPEWAEVDVINPTSSSAPGPRVDHATLWHQPSRSMLVFGGRDTPTGNPSDDALYRLAFNSTMTEATWSKLSVTGPSARADMALAYDPGWTHNSHTHAFLSGGENASGNKMNDLWQLTLNATLDSLEWLVLTDTLSGTWPSPRSNHTLIADGANHWLYLFGGRSADDTVYKAHLGGHTEVLAETKAWEPYARHTEGALTGHIAVFEDGPIYARKPEIYSVTNNDWSTLNTSRLQEWYPQTFVSGPSEVFVSGPDIVGRKLNLSSGSWSVFPPDTTIGFKGGGAVQYRPGKIMKAGSRDTDGSGANATGTTKSVNLNAGGGAAWVSSSNSMAPRVNHNLVMLPNGQVLVVGGTRVINNQANSTLEERPEIWDPELNGGAGRWRFLDTLATQPAMRDYHSTALLLPDGRVLCASGNAGSSKDSAEIYCPPYLFGADTLAPRPALLSATERWRYNADVTFSVPSNTTIARACLMHPGSTTHAHDMAQSYIPLTLLSDTVITGARHYYTKAPLDSVVAPPGDYLLFASNSAGVPSIAQWVRVGSNTDRQYDHGAPDELSFSTTFIYCNEISPIYWNAPGDDGGVGTALDYDIRYSFSPINSGNFGGATPMTQAGIPLRAGTLQTGSGFSGLSPATTVYIAGKTYDKTGAASSYAYAEFATLPSCGGGGYGTSSQRAREDESASRSPRAPAGARPPRRAFAAPSSMLSGSSTLRLVGEYDTEGDTRRWRLLVVDLEGDEALLGVTSTHAVVQSGSAAAGWSTQSSTALPGGDVGIRTLPVSGRIIFPAGAWIESVELEPRGYECTEVLHSRLGDLSNTPDSTIAGEVTPSDSLSLAFSPAVGEGSGASLFCVRVPEATGASAARRPEDRPTRSPEPLDVPAAFALHAMRPNPFSAAVSIRFDLPVAEHVRMEIFDVQGRRIATVLDETRTAGRHSTEWRGSTEAGTRAPAGIYLCRMSAGSFVTERRMTLLP